MHPDDQPPDDDFVETGRQAMLAAHYLRTLKDQGLCEYEAIELTREWMGQCFDRGEAEGA